MDEDADYRAELYEVYRERMQEQEEEARGAQEDEDEEEDEKQEEEEEEKVAAPLQAMRVIFLELDGVLNARPDSRLILLEGGPCLMLRRLLQASGATLVLSTSWRRHHEYILQALTNFGVFGEAESPSKVLLHTAPHADASRKDLEILNWLRKQKVGASGVHIISWVSLDTADLLQWPSAPHLEGHVVRVSPEVGLSQGNVEAALEVLGLGSAALEGRAGPASDRSAAASAASANAAFSEAGNAFRTAAFWDDELATKMSALLGALGQCSPESVAASGSAAARAPPKAKPAAPQLGGAGAGPDAVEFDALWQQARSRFAPG